MSRDDLIRKAPGKHSKRTLGRTLRDQPDIERETAREQSKRNEDRREAGHEAGPTDLRPSELGDEDAR